MSATVKLVYNSIFQRNKFEYVPKAPTADAEEPIFVVEHVESLKYNATLDCGSVSELNMT